MVQWLAQFPINEKGTADVSGFGIAEEAQRLDEFRITEGEGGASGGVDVGVLGVDDGGLVQHLGFDEAAWVFVLEEDAVQSGFLEVGDDPAVDATAGSDRGVGGCCREVINSSKTTF